MTPRTTPIPFRRAPTWSLGWNNILRWMLGLLDPVVLALSLWGIAWLVEGRLGAPYLTLSLVVFSLTFPGTARLEMRGWALARHVLSGWATLAGLLLLFGYATDYIWRFDREAIGLWLVAAPLCVLGAHGALRALTPWLLHLQGESKRAVIAGANAHGLALAQELEADAYIDTRMVGFFDDRAQDRAADTGPFPLLGALDDLPRYARENRIEVIYLALPMATQPRIVRLLDALCDSTVSIYFIPDIFVTDLMQGRMDAVGDLPVVSVCETPFNGLNALVKRISDIVISALILLAISPLLLAIAAAVKMSSPGPVIYRQRRYGLAGEEILVSKFRSMTTTDDGRQAIVQAKRDDPRITRVGGFLRRSSLDELPQFFDVLVGRMSIVGPRPHAVAQNEAYRKSIKGYMVRHKVKPGITGWAQVNGWRGETETLDKMEMRVAYDLAYLRNWSLRLDLYIIFKTIAVVFNDRHAY
ncbi:MAG: undecaprenyl-phosphate glucose phosphotransferase [Betaproteobacteria bacterium]|nr:undecaprenyl-phosphate glucose phosphotransferase [Betaproteobacteria bacterium]